MVASEETPQEFTEQTVALADELWKAYCHAGEGLRDGFGRDVSSDVAEALEILLQRIREAEVWLRNQKLRRTICPYLRSCSGDLHDLTRLLVPVLLNHSGILGDIKITTDVAAILAIYKSIWAISPSIKGIPVQPLIT
jgi:hypothetical protein